MPAQQNKNQIPFTVHGFITDPKSVGYQILTNYECIYWRALVGAEAWSLYEVLRSFCHGEEKICYPSIKLLCDILGLKDRRRLTGRKSKSAGKEYKYPGLIDALQAQDLVIAEVTGEEPMTNYIFHVNMTPSLLNEKQIQKLPETLQRKHGDLLQKHQAALAALKSIKRPSKTEAQVVDNHIEERDGNLPAGGVAIWQKGDGNLPPKQQQDNNTQYNNNISKEVVVKMISFGFEKELAQQMANQYSTSYIRDKIEFLEFEISRAKVKNPFRWLYKAIHADFSAPHDFKKPKLKSSYNHFLESSETNQEQQVEHEKKQISRQKRREYLTQKFKTRLADFEFWEEAKDDLKESFAMEPGIYNAYLANADILNTEGNLVQLGFTSDFFINRLSESSVKKKIESVLSNKAGQLIEVQFEVIKDSLYG